MATADPALKSQEKPSRLKPFAWMKRLTKTKSSSSDRGAGVNANKTTGSSAKPKILPAKQNGKLSAPERGQNLPASDKAEATNDFISPSQNESSGSLAATSGSNQPQTENNSIAPTVETNPGTVYSDIDHHSKGGTNTIGGAMSSTSGGGNSIFTSSNHSSHSLTTTLTTIQSGAPSSHILNQQVAPNASGTANTNTVTPASHHQAQSSQASSYFNHQYPTAPASAIPSHLNPHAHMPTTYRSATANNLLSDNASVITLASSSYHRVRRNSVDTDASIRAIAPSSTWGGSRESLPLSVLSQSTTNEPILGSTAGSGVVTSSPGSTSHSHSVPSQLTNAAGQQPNLRPHSAMSGPASAERASFHGSSGGVGAPARSSERNSIYERKTGAAGSIGGTDGASLKGTQGTEGGSIRSDIAGHGRSGSITGSIGGYSSPLATPKELVADAEKESG